MPTNPMALTSSITPRAVIEPGRSVTFTSERRAGDPMFRLRYAFAAPVLSVEFAMSLDGGSTFRPIAVGTLHKADRP